MGGAMARNLTEAGWQVLGIDTDSAKCAELARAGVAIQPDVASLAHAAPMILLSLPSPAAARSVAAAIAASGAPPRTVAEVSTLALADKLAVERVLREAGHAPLDCPISGTGAQAAVKDLVIYASGDSAAIEAARPVFADVSRALYDLGVFGNGSRMKFVANLLVAIHNVASAEAMVLGMKAGLDPQQIVEVIGNGAGASRVFQLRAPMMAANSYEPATARISMFQKDLSIINHFANELGCPTPMLSATVPYYNAAMSSGLAAADAAAVCAVLESMAGVERA
jgi:3-hydroxyisobutyrate dehydrogenase-like beta-hydroxyacid dehydrogenase